MTVRELNRDQLEELKQHYLTEQYDLRGEGISYGELAAADELVSDEEIFAAYEHVDFVPDDFWCTVGMEGCGLISYLQAQHDSRASFYGKAVIEDDGEWIDLYSYGTPVAMYDKKAGHFYIKPNDTFAPNGKYSTTTTRHIREFAKQLGINVGKATVGVY